MRADHGRVSKAGSDGAFPGRVKRWWLALAIVLVVVLGLLSRRDAVPLPGFVRSYAGDTLWAVMVVLGLAFLRPDWKLRVLVPGALGIAVAVECSQLYRAPWIEAVRCTLPGHLVLGQGFLWSDLACYAVGVVLGGGLLAAMARRAGGTLA